MKLIQSIAVFAAAISLTACGEGGFGKVHTDKTQDYGFKPHNLSTMTAGIMVDPDGCDTWLIDDGIEGYWMRRTDRYGKPVCSGVAPPNTVIGAYKQGGTINDPL